jgi:uncharacterized protein YegP (UPF0339 family)
MFQLYKDNAGYWRWRLLATNNRVIADSGESYHNRADCEHGINLLKQVAPAARVV